MSNVRQSRRVTIVLLGALVCFCLVIGLLWRKSALTAAAQGPVGSKMVYLDAQLRIDPVTYIEVTTEGQEIQPGMSAGVYLNRPAVPFQADNDWLKNMVILLLNRTKKEIVRAEFGFYFLDTGDGSPSRPVTMYTLTLGQLPETDSFTSHGQKLPPEPDKQPLSFAPGQMLVIHLADYVDAMQAYVEGDCGDRCNKMPFAQVSKIAVRRLRFYFSDGMIWDDLHCYGIPDPNRHGQFAFKQRGRYFPGHPSENWPPPTQPFEAGQHTSN
jgi:hypothetical protein